MPYSTIEAAKTAGFPTTSEGINLTLPQINKLASIYDAVEAAGTAEKPMAIAWTQWKALYVKEGDKWVLRKTESATSAEAMIAEDPNKFSFDVAIQNNKGNLIKVRDTWIYLNGDEVGNDQIVKERLASEMAYDGIGSYDIFAHNPLIRVGDEFPENTTPIHTITIAVSAKSTVLTSAIIGKSDWIPVAAIDQQTTLSLESGDVTLTISEEALKNHLESWKDGYINVNHEDGGEIDGLKIQDAKFENGMLYHKVTPKVAEFIRNSASSGRSIEVQPLKIIDNKVVEFNGLGLAVLYPPYIPACGPEMGCSSHSSIGGKTMDDKSTAQSAVRDVFTKLAETLKLHSFNDSTNEEAGTDPNLETNKMDEIEKLTSAKIEAEHGRDEARKEVETLKSSLVEKDTALTDKDKTISEQTERLKSYETAEAEAATKLKDDQWETLKSSIPAGKLHKEEDAAKLKEEFLTDPAGFAVKLASFKMEDPQGESGAEFVPGDPASEEAADLKSMSEMNIKSGRVYST